MPAKAHKPTEESRAEVRALASFGVTQEDIAEFVGVSHVTLRKHYGEELKLSAIKANARVGKYLFNLASGQALRDDKAPASHSDCSRAAIFWAKTRMGWRDTTNLDHTSSDGSMTPKANQDASEFTRAVSSLAARLAEKEATSDTDE